jgi:aminobenzoyl-glutamate transport protein
MTQLDNYGQQTKGMLGWIERTGNKLPDPVFLFFGLILILVAISVLASLLGLSAQHPTQVDANGNPVMIHAASLLSAANIRRFLVEMPMTFTYFAPLGMVLVVMLGAGVAERSGLFATAMSAFVKKSPAFLLTPAVAFMGMMGNLAADAAYVVLIPLAGVIFAAAGRHPIAGIACAFAGVSGGFSANLLPGQLDALLLGLTQTAAQTIDPAFTVNIAGNWYFIAAMLVVFLPVIWYLTDKVIEPRLMPLTASNAGINPSSVQAESGDRELERRGLARAGYAALGVMALWVVLFVMPGTPLIEEEAAGGGRLQPFYQSLIAAFMILFLACGWAYGSATGSVKDHRDIVRMMSASMGDMAYYLVLAFAAAHFVAMFNWSNLGLIIAVNGAGLIQSVDLPITALLLVIVVTTTLINLFIGSASAKWGLLAPVLVPMLMLLGVSPEMTTATYRVGDGATNIITPLMPYFALILTFCQRWNKEFGIGSLVATMIPYSIWLLLTGMVLVVAWILFGLPLGPGVGTGYSVGG